MLSILLPLYLASASFSLATPEQLATIESLSGAWGFDGSDNSNRDFLQKPGRCGEPNVLVIRINRETTPDGAVRWRLHAGARDQHGGLVTQVESSTGVQRVTVEFFGPIGPDVDFFEIEGDRLTVVSGAVHTRFERCRT